MKLVKVTLCLMSFLAVSQSAMAVGRMDKDEVRGGQLICEGNGAGPKDGASLSSHSEDDAPVKDASSAQ